MWTKEYSNWRYTLNPRSNYKVFEIKNNTKIIGYIILKKYEKENEIPVGHICQLVCHDDYIKDSIDFAANYFSEVIYSNPKNIFAYQFRSQCFKKLKRRTTLKNDEVVLSEAPIL